MDIAALSILKNMVQVRQQVNLAVTRKVMDLAEQNGSLMNRLLGQVNLGNPVTQPNLSDLGSNVDIYV